jgi:hypothetical protein
VSNPYNYSGPRFEPDRIWGTLFIVLYSLMLAVALLMILGVTSFLAAVGVSSHGGPPFPPIFGAAFAAIAGIIVLASLGIHIVAAVGIHKSQAWGFWLTIIVSLISLGSSGGGTCLVIVPLIYSLLRLTGAVGPRPS